MSTRATYHFDNNIVVYIHYDGYPAGAASYFYAMLADGRGNFATKFIRQNELAELTNGHHGDEEYYYELSGDGQLSAYKYHYLPFCDYRKTSHFFEGSVYDFIRQYGNDEQVLVTFRREFGGTRVIPQDVAIDEVKEDMKQLDAMKGRGADNTGSYKMLSESIKQKLAAIEVAQRGMK